MSYKRQKFENGKALDAEHLNDMAKGLDGHEASCDQELTQIWAELNELRGLRDAVQSWPVMKSGANWLVGSGTFNGIKARSGIEQIHFVSSVGDDQADLADATWNVDEANSGTIKGYRHGNIITISAEGAEKIRFNADAWGYFSMTSGMKVITGLDLIDTSLVTTASALFNKSGVSGDLDLSMWHMEKNTKLNGAFYNCANLTSVKLPRYGQPNIITTESAFEGCTNLVEVNMGRGIPLLSVSSFKKCINLQKVSGLESVISIDEKAFLFTPKLTDVDLNPEIITNIGDSAFRLSSAEDDVDLSLVPNVGDMATRTARWGDELISTQQIAMPNVLLHVPGADSQLKYTDTLFGYEDVEAADGTISRVEYNIGDSGCSVFAIYHEWQCVYAGTENEKTGFLDFWSMFKANSYPRENPNSASNLLSVLQKYEPWSGSLEKVTSVDQLNTIVERLKQGLPTIAVMYSVNLDGELHSVLIIGSDSKTKKLAVLDSKVTDQQAELIWVSPADIFTAAEDNDRIWPHSYK